MMIHKMIGIPPIPLHATSTTSIDVVFWVMVGFLVALVILTTILWVVGRQRFAKKQSQVKEAGWQYEASPQPQDEKQPQAHSPEEEEILLRR